jgi:hypothetical protein
MEIIGVDPHTLSATIEAVAHDERLLGSRPSRPTGPATPRCDLREDLPVGITARPELARETAARMM